MSIKPEVLNEEKEFWLIEDDARLDEFLFGELSDAGWKLNDEDIKSLPKGYSPLIAVIDFENQCQNEGWSAVSNIGEAAMWELVKGYNWIGLDDEAEALTAVTREYSKLDNANQVDLDEYLGSAYSSVFNSTPELEDRIPFILAFVRKNPAMFGVLSDA